MPEEYSQNAIYCPTTFLSYFTDILHTIKQLVIPADGSFSINMTRMYQERTRLAELRLYQMCSVFRRSCCRQ